MPFLTRAAVGGLFEARTTAPDPTAAGTARVLVASNRGPVAFAYSEAGALTARRGSGGLVSGMQEVIRDAAAQAAAGTAGAVGTLDEPEVAFGAPPSGIVWVCAALSEADRHATRIAPKGRIDWAGFDTGAAGIRMLDVDRAVFDRAYNGVANRTLWFALHLLFTPANEPSFGATFWRDWAAYEVYNVMFAEALAAEAAPGAAVLVQDYHLTLVPGLLRKMRPDLRISHFTHTPWAPPDYFRILPDRVSRAVITGMLGADCLGFLTERWATAFHDCARDLLGAGTEFPASSPEIRLVAADLPARGGDFAADGTDFPARCPGDRQELEITHGDRRVALGVHSLGVDAAALRARAAAPDVVARAAELRALVGDRQLIVRIDRTELSKNIVRGLEAYRELLRTHPDWHGQVTHLVCAYPSRQDMPEYRDYTAAVERVAAEIDAEFSSADWRPLHLEVRDDYPRSLAALTLADVLVVNPIRDGMNLIAKEGPVVSDRDVVLVLSRETGASAELGLDALCVNPYDVTATAEALDTALRMPAAERRRRAAHLAALAARLAPGDWFRQQLAALPAADEAK